MILRRSIYRNQLVMYLLLKKNESLITCNSIRPLSVLPMFHRSLLLPVFTDPDLPYTYLHLTQSSFHKRYSTLTQAAICHHTLSTNTVPYAIFLDFKSAYDVTSVHHVMKLLRRQSLPVRLQYSIHYLMFQNRNHQLVINRVLR